MLRTLFNTYDHVKTWSQRLQPEPVEHFSIVDGVTPAALEAADPIVALLTKVPKAHGSRRAARRRAAAAAAAATAAENSKDVQVVVEETYNEGVDGSAAENPKELEGVAEETYIEGVDDSAAEDLGDGVAASVESSTPALQAAADEGTDMLSTPFWYGSTPLVGGNHELIPHAYLQQLHRVVMSLEPRKRSKFTAAIEFPDGVLRAIRYNAKVDMFSVRVDQVLRRIFKTLPPDADYMPLVAQESEIYLRQQFPERFTAAEDPFVFQRSRQHYRKVRKVNIPTGPGQPTRG